MSVLASEHQGRCPCASEDLLSLLPILPQQHWDYKYLCCPTQLYVGSGHQTLGLHACIHTESSSLFFLSAQGLFSAGI